MNKFAKLSIGAIFLGTLGMYLTLEGYALIGSILSAIAAITLIAVFKQAVFKKSQ